MASTTRYAKSGDVHIAYRTLGSGRVDVVVAEQWFSNVEIEREVRPLARFNDRLSAFARVIRFDKRGVGLSDPVPATALPTLEEWMDDLRAVLDDVGSEKAAIVTAMAVVPRDRLRGDVPGPRARPRPHRRVRAIDARR